MKFIRGQVLSSTHLDSQGERNPKRALEGFARLYAGKRMPLGQQHDLSLKSPGYAENLQVVPDPKAPEEWLLIADVHYEDDALVASMGGFSISFLEIIRKSKTQDLFHVYLPFPFYKDEQLVDSIFEEGKVSVGRWAKKAAEPTTIGVIGATLIFIIKPIWEDAYKTKIAPHVYRFFEERFSKMKAKGISADFIQYVECNGYETQVIFIPERGSEEHCFGIEVTNDAMKLVHERIGAMTGDQIPPSKILLQYETSTGSYKLLRVENRDGTLTGPV